MTEIFCTIFVDYQCQASFREKVTNLPEFCKWDNSIPFLFSVSKKILVSFDGTFSPKFPYKWYVVHLSDNRHRNFRADGGRSIFKEFGTE